MFAARAFSSFAVGQVPKALAYGKMGKTMKSVAVHGILTMKHGEQVAGSSIRALSSVLVSLLSDTLTTAHCREGQALVASTNPISHQQS